MQKFERISINREEQCLVERSIVTGKLYLTLFFWNGRADYPERFEISEEEWEIFRSDAELYKSFVADCRNLKKLERRLVAE